MRMADGQEEEPAAQADSLQRPEAAPLPHPDAVYDADPEQQQASDSGKEEPQLSFRHHIGGNNSWICSRGFSLPSTIFP